MSPIPRTLTLAALLVASGMALAQLRTIPQEAKRGEMRHVREMQVEIDGERLELAPGAQIRDAANRGVLPTAIPRGVAVKYLRDNRGLLSRVWILSPEESAAADSRR